jgi:hypothetical protein
MIITTGKMIKIDLSTLNLLLERNCETPGRVTVCCCNGKFNLPGNKEEAMKFIKAYERIINEDIEYKEGKCE